MPPKKSGQMSVERAIVFDAGSLISFSMNGITDLIIDLKKIFKGKFLITREVKKEVVDTPLKIRKFRLEALKIRELLEEGILELPSALGISDEDVSRRTEEILELANTSYLANGKPLHLVDLGESSCLALSKILDERGIKNVLAIDERTTRSLVEDHENQKHFLEKKLHVRISLDEEKVDFFSGFKIIRSAELVYVAYKKGLVKMKDQGNVLDALLYAVKFKGASISENEIEEIKRIK